MAKFDPFLSLDCARVEGGGAQSKERKGSNFVAQHSRAIVQKPEEPNTYDIKTRLSNPRSRNEQHDAVTAASRPAAARNPIINQNPFSDRLHYHRCRFAIVGLRYTM